MAQYPENTLEAFRASSAVVEMIELDVRRCGSGELVVLHDETLDRTTDATGGVASTSLDELRDVSVLGTDESPPLVSEVFEAVPPDVGLNIELKVQGIAADVVDIASEYDHEVIVSSFGPDTVTDARKAGVSSLAFLIDDDFDVGSALDIAGDLGCAYVHPHVNLCLDTDIVERAHERGFDINAWTAADRDTVGELRDRGVDGAIIGDCELAAICNGEGRC